MTTVAIYNMKGGVGKTTAAVNLAYLAATGGQRTLLWDLDPQAAASFAFRVRPQVPGFGKKRLGSSEVLAAAIKETDYENLDLLPAAFSYRKFERLLDDAGKPSRVMTALVAELGRDYGAVFLDCPAGFSLLTEGIFAACDLVIIPTIPTVLSLRTVGRLIKWAHRSDSPSELVAFFSMVDRRRALHRKASEWAGAHPDIFLTEQVPYASVVEQMALRRMPLAAFAARDPATIAFAGVWAELQTRLRLKDGGKTRTREMWMPRLQAIEALIARIELADGQAGGPSNQATVVNLDDIRPPSRPRDPVRSDLSTGAGGPNSTTAHEGHSPSGADVHFIHDFDTDRRDLSRSGYVLQLHERAGSFFVVAERPGSNNDWTLTSRCAEVRVDRAWAAEILSGVTSPIAALERRTGRSMASSVDEIRAVVGGRKLVRVDTRTEGARGITHTAAAASSSRRMDDLHLAPAQAYPS